MTMGALKEPIELLPSAQNSALSSHKRVTFAYLGPVEWNRSGAFSYSLWVHIAPGDDLQLGDIHAADALTLILDDGPMPLSVAEPPNPGRAPYQQAVSWGQTAYYGLTVDSLKRMAASAKLELDVRALDGSVVGFAPTGDTHAVLILYLKARGITGD